MTEAVCTACGHHIDPAARLCPYCGADPRNGEKPVDTRAVMEEVFRPREVTASESVIEYARQRQGLVIGVAVIVIFLGLALLHQFVTRRNAAAVTDAPPVPLTEVTDLSNQAAAAQPAEMPDLTFQHDGDPKKMRTFIVEPGALPPPEFQSPPPGQAPQQQAQSPQRPVPQRPAQARPPAVQSPPPPQPQQ